MGQVEESLAGFEVLVCDAIAVDVLQSHNRFCYIQAGTCPMEDTYSVESGLAQSPPTRTDSVWLDLMCKSSYCVSGVYSGWVLHMHYTWLTWMTNPNQPAYLLHTPSPCNVPSFSQTSKTWRRGCQRMWGCHAPPPRRTLKSSAIWSHSWQSPDQSPFGTTTFQSWTTGQRKRE